MPDPPHDPLAPILFAGAGLVWTFLRPSPPHMHLVSGCGTHRVDLDLGPLRIWHPHAPVPADDALAALDAWLDLGGGREQVERAWIRLLLARDRLHTRITPRGDIVLCVASPHGGAAREAASLRREDLRIRPSPETLGLDAETAELVLGPGRPRSEQQRWWLADLLWFPRSAGVTSNLPGMQASWAAKPSEGPAWTIEVWRGRR